MEAAPASGPTSSRSHLGSFLELFRVFLTPSAVADSFAGYSLAVSLSQKEPQRAEILLVAGTSVALYWLGMLTNDLFDVEKDRQRFPGRPLASGRVSPRAAALVAGGLATAALGLGYLAGAAAVAIPVLVLALAYNGGGKGVPLLGNLLMGSCRAGNLLLGAVAAVGAEEALRQERILAAAALLGLYIAAVTAVTLLEDRDYRPLSLHLRAAPLLFVPLALVVVQSRSLFNWLNGLALALLLFVPLRRAGRRRAGLGAVAEGPEATHAATQVARRALSGIYLVDAGCLWALSSDSRAVTSPAMALYVLALLGWLWKRHWVKSGRSDT
jgi:4-hydroxybenzoate polyprenyltransferase